MSSQTKKSASGACDDSSSSELQQSKIKEVRKLIGPQSGKNATYCSDESISRYLRARNWNVKKAVKMLKGSLKWRSEYKPEDIRWDDVALEAETGKIYRASFKDKHGRPVLIMRPRCQNTKSIKGQIRYLVYCIENAIQNLPEGEEQMVWLINFHGFNMSHISIKQTQETAFVLQDQYPERLGVAILYDPPKIFEPFWKIAKPFLEPKTANKVKFVYSNDPNTTKIMDDLFDMELVESAFGGKDPAEFDIAKYAAMMREDEKMIPLSRKLDGTHLAAAEQPDDVAAAPASSDNMNLESDSDASEVTAEKKSHSRGGAEEENDDDDDDDSWVVDGSVTVKHT